MHLSEKYIQDAIQNPLLFQQNNPLISQSMSLLNSRHKRSGDDSRDMEKFTSKELSARIRKKHDGQNQDEFRQSSSNSENYEGLHNGNFKDQDDNETQNLRAIKQFERQIQQKFKISVANKIYTFPKLKITSIMDIISSSEEQDDGQDDFPSKSTSQLTDGQFNPFDSKHYQKNRIKTQCFEGKAKSKNMHKVAQDRNFKKVKISQKKDKQKKNSSLKKEKQQTQNYSHREKPKLTKKNPEVTGTSRQTQKTKIQTQKIEKYLQKSNQKNPKPWVAKQSQTKKSNYVERLKTQMDNNGSNEMSESITESKKRFYEEEFFIKK